MAEAGAAAVTAIFSLSAIKSGILNAQGLNSSLEVQSKLIGQNASAMRLYAAATEVAGGSQQGFQSDIQGLFSNLASSGLSLPDVKSVIDHLRGVFSHYNTPSARELGFQRLGINDQGFKAPYTSVQ